VHSRQPPIRVSETIAGTVVEREDGRLVVDFGRVIAGWVRIETRGSAGHRLELRHGEKLTGDGRPNDGDPLGYYNGRFQLDVVTLSGDPDGETWEARFGWKGFRFVEITGWPGEGTIAARVAHTDVARTGEFRTSDPVMQKIHTLTVRTILNNLHSIPTDTPKYEKNGWTADGMVGTEMFLLNLDAHELLAKWVDDIADSRGPDGVPSVIAPNSGWTYDWSPAPPWHSAYVLIPWWLYRYGGDERVIREHLDGIVRYVTAEYSRSQDGIASTTLGDWVNPETSPAGGNPPEDLRVSATVYLHLMLETAAAMSRTLGRDDDAARVGELAGIVRDAFLARFFDAELGLVRGEGDAGFRQSHNILALAHGLIPAAARQEVADRIAADVVSRGIHLNTGVLSTKYLLPVLTEYGHADLALALARQTTFPSWGFWLERGATTLWEHWHEDARSYGHFFLGTIDDWFFSSVAGISAADVAYRRIRFRPRLIGLLESASAKIATPHGPASIEWSVKEGVCDLIVRVPIGSVGEVVLPVSAGTTVTESGSAVDALSSGPGEAVVEVASGEYRYRFNVG
jgi:alpha-L-rhamnosidase